MPFQRLVWLRPSLRSEIGALTLDRDTSSMIHFPLRAFDLRGRPKEDMKSLEAGHTKDHDAGDDKDPGVSALLAEPFTIARPERQRHPFVFASPHSGRHYPRASSPAAG